MKNLNFITITFSLLMLGAGAMSISISPQSENINVNSSISFTNTTNGGIAPYSWLYYIRPIAGWLQENNTIQFTKPGTYNVSEEAYDNYGNSSYSENAVIKVNPHVQVYIYPRFPQTVYGAQQSLNANVSYGTGPYTYQWYNSSSCANEIVNATSEEYTTNVLNASASYCVIVKDSYNQTANATTTVTVSGSLNTPQGAYVGLPGYGYWLIPPTVIPIAGGYEVYNSTPYAEFNVSLCGATYNMAEEDLTPTYAVLNIEDTEYNLTPFAPLPFGNPGCFAELVNISWAPILQTSTFEFYYQAPTTTSISSTTTSSTTTMNTTTMIQNSTTQQPSIGTTVATSTVASTNTIVQPASYSWLEWPVGLIITAILLIVAAFYIRSNRTIGGSGGYGGEGSALKDDDGKYEL